MLEILAAWAEWLHPEMILESGGYWLLLLIVFLETGIFFGFFLPGDSLLLTAGLLCGSVHLEVSILELLLGLSVAGFLGSMVGYAFGRKAGNFLLMKQENFFFKKKYLSIAEDYYLRYGNMAFVLGRFLPIVRTFIPILAGFVKSNLWTFVWLNMLGTSVWVGIFVLGGYWLARIFPSITQYTEFFVLFLIFITSVPLLISWLKKRKQPTQTVSKKVL